MRSPTRFFDRREGRLRDEPIYAHEFLDWCYNSSAGWMLTGLVLSRPFVSRAYGWLHKTRWSRRLIPGFVERMQIDLSESLTPAGEFKSFNDLIVREIDLSRRPISPEPGACVAPADSRILAFPRIEADRRFAIKRAEFDLRGLLADPALARDYAGGAMVVCRLYLNDYHHFHFPDGGIPGRARSIAGRCLAVTPYPRKRLVPFYARNRRMLTLFESDHFGRMALVEVGAFTVGSIRQCYRDGIRVPKGGHKGYFELGGSIVVLLFRSGRIRLDEDLCSRTREGVETYVRLGEAIGRA